MSVSPMLVAGLSMLALGARGEDPGPAVPVATIEARQESQELVGPYQQPRWSARGRFSGDTDVYVLPPGEFFVDANYRATIPRHGRTAHLFTQEFEAGLPYRTQLAYENNVEIKDGHSQVTEQTFEARYALADWGKIPLNPTLFAEYKLGVGKDFGAQEDPGDPIPGIPDAFEVRILLGEQLTPRLQWALNLFHEQQTGGEREWETGFSQAFSYAVLDEDLKVGMEMQFIRETEFDSRWDPEYQFNIGPSFTWKPSRRSRLDVAALFGTTEDSPSAKIFAVFSYAYGETKESEVETPVSGRRR